MILGAVFLGVKVIEYEDKFEHHHVPGPNFVWAAEHDAAPAVAARITKRRPPPPRLRRASLPPRAGIVS